MLQIYYLYINECCHIIINKVHFASCMAQTFCFVFISVFILDWPHDPPLIFFNNYISMMRYHGYVTFLQFYNNIRITHRLTSINLYQEAREEPEDKFDDLCDAISDPTTQ